MTQRERVLAILVGGMLIASGIWWGFGKYRTAIKDRNNEITRLEQEQQRLVEQRLQGEYANRQMGEYTVRSLPSKLELAQSRYQQWLLMIVQDAGLADASVDPTNSRPVAGLYQQMGFRVTGKTKVPNIIGLLHAFYSKDYLHRIRDLSVRPNRTGDFSLELGIESIALLSAPEDLPEPGSSSWQVDGDLAAYQEPILNRNFFQPPNQAPRFEGQRSIEAIVGRETPAPLTFKDSEGHRMKFELVDGPSDLVSLNDETGTLRVNSETLQEFPVTVRVTDDGYPARSTEETLTVKVVEPPPPPEPEPPKMKFDDSKQTVLTALVQGRDEWTAWMHVRTRDQTLKLRVGDEFEVGTLKGQVVEVTPRYVMLEIEGRKFSLKPAGNLNEAAASAQPASPPETAEPADPGKAASSDNTPETSETPESE